MMAAVLNSIHVNNELLAMMEPRLQLAISTSQIGLQTSSHTTT